MAEFSAKVKRQVSLLAVFKHAEAIICLDVIKKNVPGINMRMLERDIRELNGAGFADVRYDRNRRVWRGGVYIPDEIPEMPSKRHRDYENIVHFEKILFGMECLTAREIDMALDELHDYQDMHGFWIEDGKYGPEPEYEEKYIDKEKSADKVYFRMFPEARKSDFEKDVRFLCDIGYPIVYDEELDVYYSDFREELMA